MSESKFPKSAREAAWKLCDEADEGVVLEQEAFAFLRRALDEIDRLEAENADLRKQVAERDEALEFSASQCLRLIRSQLEGEPVAYSYCCHRFGERVHGPQFRSLLAAIQDAMKKGGVA